MGAHKDRHANIGEVELGIAGVKRIISHSRLCRLPFNLVTHHELSGYKAEIELVRGLFKET